MKEDINLPKITGIYKHKYGIHHKSLKILHNQLHKLYSNTDLTNTLKPKQLHNIITNFFINEYYPSISKQFHTNNKTIPLIMGTVAFNMNIPIKLKYFNVPTDDVDLKIYTTELHYDKKKNNIQNVKNVISLFKYIIVMIFMFMKQILYEILYFTKHIFKNENKKQKKNNKSNKTIKNSKSNKTIKNNKSNKTIKNNKSMKTNKLNYVNNNNNNNNNSKIDYKLLNNSQKQYGFINSGKISIQIKHNSGIDDNQETIDLTNLSYEETYNILFKKVNNIDLLITSKFKYNISYSKLIKKPNVPLSFTFSDTKIYYPNIEQNATFYSYYLLNNKDKLNDNLTIDKLHNLKLNINEIIKVNHCNRYTMNCNYIAINSLKIDLVLMLQYAEFINLENSNIDVPISSLFKYLKYLKKYLFLHIIIKFHNKTLTKEYNIITSKLLTFINNKLIKKIPDREPEYSIKNIEYKKIINEFHQNFFIKQTMFPEFKLLKGVIDDYNYTKEYINKSRFLFKNLFLNNYYNKQNKEDTCSNLTNLNILKFLFTKQENNKNNKNNKNNNENFNLNTKNKFIHTLKGGKINTYEKIIKKTKFKSNKCKTKCCLKKKSFILYNINNNDIYDVNNEFIDVNNEFIELKQNIKKSFILKKSIKTKTKLKIKNSLTNNNLKNYEINEIKKELKKSFNNDIHYLQNLNIN